MKIEYIWKTECSQRFGNTPNIYEEVGQVLLLDDEHKRKHYTSHDLKTGEILWERSCQHHSLTNHGLLINSFFIFDGRKWDDDLWGDLIVMSLEGKSQTWKEVRFGFYDHHDGNICDNKLNIYDVNDLNSPIKKSTLCEQIVETDEVLKLYPNTEEIRANVWDVLKDRYIIKVYGDGIYHTISIKRQQKLKIEYILKGEANMAKSPNFLIVANEDYDCRFYDISNGKKLFNLKACFNFRDLGERIVMHDTQNRIFYSWDKKSGLQQFQVEDQGEDFSFWLTDKFIFGATCNNRRKFKMMIYDFTGKVIHKEELNKGYEVYSITNNYLGLYKAGEIHLHTFTS